MAHVVHSLMLGIEFPLTRNFPSIVVKSGARSGPRYSADGDDKVQARNGRTFIRCSADCVIDEDDF